MDTDDVHADVIPATLIQYNILFMLSRQFIQYNIHVLDSD